MIKNKKPPNYSGRINIYRILRYGFFHAHFQLVIISRGRAEYMLVLIWFTRKTYFLPVVLFLPWLFAHWFIFELSISKILHSSRTKVIERIYFQDETLKNSRLQKARIFVCKKCFQIKTIPFKIKILWTLLSQDSTYFVIKRTEKFLLMQFFFETGYYFSQFEHYFEYYELLFLSPTFDLLK